MANDVVLVTGSSGLIGAAVVRSLVGRFRVVGFDRAGPPHPPPEADCVSVDLSSDESVRSAFVRVRNRHGARIASVIHLAAYYDFKGDPSPLYDSITVRGTERMLRELQAFDVEQFLFSSTLLVHAPNREPIDESSPLAPSWEYPASKVRTEELLRARHGPIPIVLLRIAGVYDDWGHSIPLVQQIDRIAARKLTSRFFPADPSVGQSFVHLEDTVDAIVRCVDRRRTLPSETVLLIGEPETVGYGELQSIVARNIYGRKWRTWRVPKLFAKAGAWIQTRTGLGGETFIRPWMIDRAGDHYVIDIFRARDLLGWKPRHRLRNSLPRILAHLARDPRKWYRENGLPAPPHLEPGAMTAGRRTKGLAR